MQQELVAGDALNYATSIPAYPPSEGWVARLRMVPRSGGAAIAVQATADAEDRHAWALPKSTTAAWVAGLYSWAIWVEKGTERYTLQNGQITIKPDPETMASGTDGRSQAERSLDAINAFLEGRASDAQLRYKINGRELERYPLQDALRLRAHFERQVADERRAAGLSDGRGTVRRILVRMP